jgi:hypothetical protein
MSLPFSIDRIPGQEPLGSASRDHRALRILAKSIYRELRRSGLVEEDVMSVAGELLSLVAGEVKDRRLNAERLGEDSPGDDAPSP